MSTDRPALKLMEDEAAITRMADRLLAEVSMETLAVQIADREMARELLRDLLRAAHPAAQATLLNAPVERMRITADWRVLVRDEATGEMVEVSAKHAPQIEKTIKDIFHYVPPREGDILQDISLVQKNDDGFDVKVSFREIVTRVENGEVPIAGWSRG